jgi:hypothetical protein
VKHVVFSPIALTGSGPEPPRVAGRISDGDVVSEDPLVVLPAFVNVLPDGMDAYGSDVGLDRSLPASKWREIVPTRVEAALFLGTGVGGSYIAYEEIPSLTERIRAFRPRLDNANPLGNPRRLPTSGWNAPRRIGLVR